MSTPPDPKVPLPSWHEDEARRRAAELDADPSLAIDREELWRRIAENDA